MNTKPHVNNTYACISFVMRTCLLPQKSQQTKESTSK